VFGHGKVLPFEMVAFAGCADIDRPAAPIGSDAYDPEAAVG